MVAEACTHECGIPGVEVPFEWLRFAGLVARLRGPSEVRNVISQLPLTPGVGVRSLPGQGSSHRPRDSRTGPTFFFTGMNLHHAFGGKGCGAARQSRVDSVAVDAAIADRRNGAWNRSEEAAQQMAALIITT
jgi:hypothetical protein